MREQEAQLFEKLESQRKTLLAEMAQYSPEQLTKTPAPGKWSANQVILHLIVSEKLSHQYCAKKLSFNPELEDAGPETEARMQSLETYLGSPQAFPAPPNVGDIPEAPDLTSLDQEWIQQRQALKTFLEAQPDHILQKEIYKHPLSGRITLFQMLRFFELHTDRHRAQIFRAIEA